MWRVYVKLVFRRRAVSHWSFDYLELLIIQYTKYYLQALPVLRSISFAVSGVSTTPGGAATASELAYINRGVRVLNINTASPSSGSRDRAESKNGNRKKKKIESEYFSGYTVSHTIRIRYKLLWIAYTYRKNANRIVLIVVILFSLNKKKKKYNCVIKKCW